MYTCVNTHTQLQKQACTLTKAKNPYDHNCERVHSRSQTDKDSKMEKEGERKEGGGGGGGQIERETDK